MKLFMLRFSIDIISTINVIETLLLENVIMLI